MRIPPSTQFTAQLTTPKPLAFKGMDQAHQLTNLVSGRVDEDTREHFFNGAHNMYMLAEQDMPYENDDPKFSQTLKKLTDNYLKTVVDIINIAKGTSTTSVAESMQGYTTKSSNIIDQFNRG